MGVLGQSPHECQVHHRSEFPRCELSEAGMRTHFVVFPSPGLDDYLGFPEVAEGLGVQALIPELAVEALAQAVLPRAARWHIEGLAAIDRKHTFGLMAWLQYLYACFDGNRLVSHEGTKCQM